MANQRRSVWEIRFRALQQFIRTGMDDIDFIAGRSVLDDNLQGDKLEKLKYKKEILSSIRKRANNLENESAGEIWLDCDY